VEREERTEIVRERKRENGSGSQASRREWTMRAKRAGA
jgi:hypothetical protein